jgi:hypothetical protein
MVILLGGAWEEEEVPIVGSVHGTKARERGGRWPPEAKMYLADSTAA